MPSRKPSTSSPKKPRKKADDVAIVSYVPALHAGYKRLFDRYPGADIYVLDESIVEQFEHLRKELRGLKPPEAAKAIAAWGHKTETIAWVDIPHKLASYITVVAPRDEIAEKLQQHVAGLSLRLEEVFLRWDRRVREAAQDALDPDRVVSMKASDRALMQQVVEEAKKSTNIWRRVGAAIVKNGKVVSIMANQHQPLPHSNWTDGDPRNNANRGTSIDISTDMHAEARLIADAAKRGMALEGCEIYVVTFPCPTCAKLIANSGIKSCYYAVGYAVLDGKEVLQAYGVRLVQVEGVAVNDPNPAVWMPYPEKQQPV